MAKRRHPTEAEQDALWQQIDAFREADELGAWRAGKIIHGLIVAALEDWPATTPAGRPRRLSVPLYDLRRDMEWIAAVEFSDVEADSQGQGEQGGWEALPQPKDDIPF